jgi:histone-lysine N-methyltransferase SETD3
MSNFGNQDKLLEWLKLGKSAFNKVSLKEVEPEYRVIMAEQTIDKDKIVIQIPLTHIITTEKAKMNPIFKVAEEPTLNDNCKIDTSDVSVEQKSEVVVKLIDVRSNHTYLAVHLLNEKRNPDSFWQPYIKSLPQTYSNMPINFNDKELSYLKGSFTLDKITQFHNDLKLEYENLLRQKPELSEWLTYKDWVWAKVVVITRVFSLLIKGVKTEGLVPLVDMCNHSLKSETTWRFEDSLDSFVLCAKEKIWSGNEIYDSYGRKCNSRFFVNYGFTLPNNQEDNRARLKISMDFKDESPLHKHKLSLVGGEDKIMLLCLQYTEKDTFGNNDC